MKKILIILFVSCLCGTQNLFAQNSPFSFGIEASGNLSNQNGNSLITQFAKAKIGYGLGINAQYNFNERYALRSGVSVEQKGFREDREAEFFYAGQLINDRYQHSSNFYYATIPLLFRVTMGKDLKYFVNAGPYAGFLFGQKDVTKPGTLITGGSLDNSQFFKYGDYGLAGGLGASLRLSANKILGVEVRHSLGLANISILPIFGGGAIRNNTTSLIVSLSGIAQRKKKEES